MRHYHVMAATVGCMPDTNEVFTNRRDAERYAVELARDYRECGYTVAGSARWGYAIEPINYIAVEPCNDVECQTPYDDTH